MFRLGSQCNYASNIRDEHMLIMFILSTALPFRRLNSQGIPISDFLLMNFHSLTIANRVLRGNIANACILVLMSAPFINSSHYVRFTDIILSVAFALLTLFFQTWDEKRAKKAGKTDASIEAQDTPSEVEKEDVVLDATPVLRTV